VNINTPEYWDAVHASMEGPVSDATRDYRFVHQAILPLIPTGSRVLDVGCGDGQLCEALVEQGCDVVGLDFSRRAVAMCRAKGIAAFRCVLPDTPGETISKFDVAVCSSVLAQLDEPERAVAAMCNHVRSGGLIVIAVPAPVAIDRNPEHVHLFGRHDVLELVMSAATDCRCIRVTGERTAGQCDHWLAWGRVGCGA
jgi:2-polyprenyl-3-methyl-5-hydroxy-6-metoxy-1,4-benzoquinol methylase